MIILLSFLAIILIIVYIRYFKSIRCGNMICITGGIKTGKSALSVRQAVQLHRKQLFKARFYNWFARYILTPFRGFKIPPKKELPVLYSNIPLNYPHVRITKELLERKQRPIYGSVAYICEASLVADSMTFRDPLLNEELQLFNKLWGHSSKGGYLIYDTQSIADNHYTVKRCLNSYFYIHHTIKVPFFMIMFLQELRYSEDTTNVNQGDLERAEPGTGKGFMIHIVPKSVWRIYDCYCYSCLTDDKPKLDGVVKNVSRETLKATSIVSFKDYKSIGGDYIGKK